MKSPIMGNHPHDRERVVREQREGFGGSKGVGDAGQDDFSVAVVQGDEADLKRQVRRQAALLSINQAVQEMARPSDLARVTQVCLEEVKSVGLDVQAMAIHRVIAPDRGTVETFRVGPKGVISVSQRRKATRITEHWRAGKILYEKDIYRDEDMKEIEYFRAKFDGLPVRCHLNVPFSRGVISALSIRPAAFSELDVQILRYVAEIFSVGISRVEDLERVEASQREVRQSEERYRQLVELSPDAIFVHVEGSIVFANLAATNLFGAITPDELIGRSVFDLVHPDCREVARERTRTVTGEKKSVAPVEQRFIRLDGTVIEVEAVASFFTFQGRPAVQAIARDITERKKLEQQLFQAQKMEAIGTLAGGVAHDFNNELTGIIGYAQLALLEPEDSSRWREYVARIPEQGKRAARLISQLLTFGRRAMVEKQPLQLLPLVKESLKMLERTLPEHIAIQSNAPAGVAIVHADPTQMQQMILNLCINASQAMPNGGRLILSLENVALYEAYCRQHACASPGNHVCLSVRDTGVGMTPEVQAHIFEPFFTTKPAGQGTGLGLAMVYGIVKGHTGHIAVTSEVGRGSEFKVYLPAMERATPLEQAAEERPVRGTETLLLVEDQDTVRVAGQMMLERLGYTVLTAANGREALEVYRARRDAISLVLTDMVMPEMGGPELYEALRQVNPFVRLLMMSGYSLKQDLADLRRKGMRGFVQKPLEMGQLSRAVRKALDA